MPSESHGTHDQTPAEREEALVRKAASNAEVGDGDLVEMAAQLRGRAAWYDDARPGSVKTPQLLRQAADLLDGRRAPQAQGDGVDSVLAARVLDVMERINEAYRPKPGFASEVGANAFDYALIDLRAALAPKEGAPTADLGRAVGAWAEIAEHYRCAMLAAETAINSTPMPVSDGQTSLIWKRFSEAATGLHTARMDMIHKYGPAFLNSGPIGPAALPAQAAEPVAVKASEQAIFKIIVAEMQLHDFGRQTDDGFVCTGKQIDLLEECARRAAGKVAALSGAAPQAGEDVPKHIAFRRAALARAAELDGSAFAGDLDPLDDDDTVEGLARSVAIVLAGYDWTVDPTSGRIVACVAADQGFAATTLVVDDATRRAVSAPPVEGWRPTHRHKKRGSEYQVIAQGRLQVDGYLDMERVTIYRARNGETWVRPDYEFNDGRFEALPTQPDSQGGEDAAH